ncbi:hypothetical protein F2Q69_00019803 [Brassica cretica]|uniref:Uncharacterized protein n=1 Tax=Brassica cretica TaxID=69181 RepID=A0A8S9QT86_BRACR|nr:hypothetical protein F2Q69_00019803 [Brassica cretica]
MLEEAEKLDGGGRRRSFTRWRKLDEQTAEEAEEEAGRSSLPAVESSTRKRRPVD